MKLTKITHPPLSDSLINFILEDKEAQYKHFNIDVSYIYDYVDILWKKINPENQTILNMGVGNKTPKSLLGALNYKGVVIKHIELDNKRDVDISDNEEIIWQTDFFNYLKKSRKNSIDGIVFWHGPEHLEGKIGRKAIRHALRVARKWVIVSCPWDRLKGWKAGKKLSKKKKRRLGHKSVWTEKDFLKVGLKTMTAGTRNIYPSFMLGWRLINDKNN